MGNKPDPYRVLWTRPALKSLAKLFNIDHDYVFKRSQFVLSREPNEQADGVSDYPRYFGELSLVKNKNKIFWLLVHTGSLCSS